MVMMMVALLSIVIASCAGGSGHNASQSSSPEKGDQTIESNNNSEESSNNGESEASANGDTLVVSHELGDTTVSKHPEKVVVFDFGTLDTLDKLGVKVIGVPQANVPGYLSKYADEPYVNVGSLKEPDFETIYGLQPDLIIISGRQMDLYDELSEIAPTIYVAIDNENYMESFQSNATVLGEIFGKEDAVVEELAQIEERIAALNERMSASEEKGLVILVTGGKVSAYGPNSRFGIIHDVFGVQPVDENIEASTHGMIVSFEYIAEQNPDYLFVIDRDAVVGDAEAASAAAVLDNELVHGTNAYQNDQIVYLAPDYWYLSGGGLVSVSEMLKEIEEGVQ